MRIDPLLHNRIDYALVVVLLISPTLLDLSGAASYFTYALALVHLCLTLATDNGAHLRPLVSFPAHGLFELFVTLSLVGVAFYMGRASGTTAKTFYLVLSILLFLFWLFTPYEEEPA